MKRIISLFIAVTMLITFVPYAFAAEDANIETAVPANGSDTLSFVAPTVKVIFDTDMDASTITAENITMMSTDNDMVDITPAVEDDNRTVDINVNGTLMAETGYTLEFSDSVKTYDGGSIAASSRSLEYTTISSFATKEDWSFGVGSVGHNNLKSFNGWGWRGTAQYNGDSAYTIELNHNETLQLVYYFPDGLTSMYANIASAYYKQESDDWNEFVYECSPDGITYTECEPVMSTPGDVIDRANFVCERFTLSTLPSGTKYFRFTFKRVEGRSKTSTCWARVVEGLYFNYDSVKVDESELTGSMPHADSTDAQPSDEIRLTYNAPLYTASASADKFTVSDRNVTAVSFEDCYRTAVLHLDAVTGKNESYTVSTDGIKDVYGNDVNTSISFKTTGTADIVSCVPKNGAVNAAIDTEPKITFSAELDADTVSAKNLSVTPDIPVKSAELMTDGKTIMLSFDTNLMTATQYTVNFSDDIKTADGNKVDGEYSFTTSAAYDMTVNDFDVLYPGVDGLYAMENDFEREMIHQDILDDKTRISLGDRDESSLIFTLDEGIRDFSLELFDVSYETAGKGSVSFAESRDGVNYTDVTYTEKKLLDYSALNQELNLGFDKLVSYSGTASEGAKYLKVTLSRSNTSFCWTPRLKRIVLNSSLPENTGTKLAEYAPADGEAPSRTIMLTFDRPLYRESVTKDKFTVTDNTIDDIYITDDNKTVYLYLGKVNKSNSEYTLSMSGIKNIYNAEVEEEFTFKTGGSSAFEINEKGFLKDGEKTALQDGTLTPYMTVNNKTDETQNVTFITAIYDKDSGRLKSVKTKKQDVASGENTVELNDIEIASAQNTSVKLLAWDSINGMQPITGIVNEAQDDLTVDAEYYPGFVKKAVVLSFDDGPMYSDITMMNYLNEKNIKATFNLKTANISTALPSRFDPFYLSNVAPHEIANHTSTHPYLGSSYDESCKVISDGKNQAEAWTGRIVRGFAYPYSRPYGVDIEKDVADYIESLGMVYSRVSETTGKFDIPEDFSDWHFTSSQLTLDGLDEEFYNLNTDELKVMSIWGHTWELDADANANPPRTEECWSTVLVPLLNGIDEHRDELWSATCIDFYDYINAKNSLEETDETLYNGGSVPVYVKVGEKEAVILPGQKIYKADAQLKTQKYVNEEELNTIKRISSAPKNGSEDNAYLNQSITLTFAEALDRTTVSSDTVKLSDGETTVLSDVTLSEDGETITVVPKGTLMADTLYTVEVTPQVTTPDGKTVATGSRKITFSTKESMEFTDDFDEAPAVGKNNLIRIEGNVAHENPDGSPYDGDTGDITLGANRDSALVYYFPEGVDSFRLYTSESPWREGDPDHNFEIYYQYSSDDETYFDIDADKKRNEDEVYTNSTPYYYEVSKLPDNTKYIRVEMKCLDGCSDTAWLWTPRIMRIVFNPVNTGNLVMSESLPVNKTKIAEPKNVISLTFNSPLYTSILSEDSFEINDNSVSQIDYENNSKTINLTLASPMEELKDYVLTGTVKDIYGNSLDARISFTTYKQITKKSAGLYDSEGQINDDLTAGEFFVKAVIFNRGEQTPYSVSIFARAFDTNDDILDEVKYTYNGSFKTGENEITADDLLTVTATTARTEVTVYDGAYTDGKILADYNVTYTAAAELPLTIYLVGDSICSYYNEQSYPQQGWGTRLGNYFVDGVTVENRAQGGRSSRSFIEEGLWDKILETLKPGDYVFVSMGTNDQGTNPAVTTTVPEYKMYLKQYIDDTRDKGANIVFVSLNPDAWNESIPNTTLVRSQAMQAVAEENEVTFVDMNTPFYNEMKAKGIEASRKAYFMDYEVVKAMYEAKGYNVANHANGYIRGGTSDYTHITEAGADFICQIITDSLAQSTDPLGKFVKKD